MNSLINLKQKKMTSDQFNTEQIYFQIHFGKINMGCRFPRIQFTISLCDPIHTSEYMHDYFFSTKFKSITILIVKYYSTQWYVCKVLTEFSNKSTKPEAMKFMKPQYQCIIND